MAYFRLFFGDFLNFTDLCSIPEKSKHQNRRSVAQQIHNNLHLDALQKATFLRSRAGEANEKNAERREA